jgi:hypothetical protein
MSATLVTPKTTSGGEIVRELVNSSDGAGLHFDGAVGSIDIASPPDLGTKLSFEFVCKVDDPSGTQNGLLVDFGGGSGRAIFGASSSISGNFGIYYNSAWATFGLNPLTDGSVHHLVASIDGTTATLYDNGNQIATATIGSLNIDGCTDARIGTNFVSTGGFFEGTIYRARFYNKALSSAEVQTAYERADVDFADQYGSQTSLVDAGASVFTSGTYSWSAYGSNTIANVGNALEITYVNHASGASNGLRNSSDLTTDLVVGKRYRLTVDAKYTGGSAGSKLQLALAGSNTDFATLTTSLVTYTYEFTTDTATGGVFRMSGMSAGNVVTIDNWYLREIGCVSDYDLAFANPTQSLTVQDRAGAADGTASASGVTQVQPVVQGNLTSLAVTTSQQAAGVPADGAIVADNVGIGVAPDVKLAIKDNVDNTNESGIRLLRSANSDCGWINMRGGAFNINTRNNAANAGLPVKVKMHGSEVFTIDSTGEVKVIGSGSTGATLRLENTTTSTAADDIAGTVNFYTNDASTPSGGRVCGYVRSVADDQYNRYGLRFGTANFNETVAERMSIDSSGNVGVNCDPDAKLEVNGDAIWLGNAASNASGRILFNEDTSSNGISGFSLLYAGSPNPTLDGTTFTAAANSFNIFRHNSSAAGAVVMSIERTSGAVSIGSGTAAVTTLKPSLLVTDTSAGGSVTIRGLSPVLAFDVTSSGTGTILTDGGGLNVKDGTLDGHGNTLLAIDKTSGLASFSNGITVSGGVTSLGSFTNLDISSGAITITSSTHRVDTESGAASDDLDTINGGIDGSVLYLRTNLDTRDVTVKDATGNIYLAGDFALNNSQRILTLIKRGNSWYEVSRSANA